MKQKDDRKYTFVVTRSYKNTIWVKRLEISKRLANTCAAVALVAVSLSFYGVEQTKNDNFNNFAEMSPLPTQTYLAAAPQNLPVLTANDDTGEGGPEITEIPTADSDSKESSSDLQIDDDHLPSIYPIIGKINDNFGWRRNPFGGGSGEFHPGLDISGKKGDSVIAPANGTVIKSAWTNGYGNMIEIDHGHGLVTRYGHLSQALIETGQEILRGQEIGKVGSTGRSTGPHLHYEVRVNGQAVSPKDYLPSNIVLPEAPTE